MFNLNFQSTFLLWCISALAGEMKLSRSEETNKITYIIFIRKKGVRAWNSPNAWTFDHIYDMYTIFPLACIYAKIKKYIEWKT